MPDIYVGEERRALDPLQDQIESLIMAAEDPKDKAFLLILNKIAGSLDVNTELTRSLSSDLKAHTDAFAQHEKDEMALINQGRGFWRATMAAVVVLQTVLGYWIVGHIEETRQIRSDLNGAMLYIESHKAHHATEEHYTRP